MFKLDAFQTHINQVSKGTEALRHLYILSSDEPLLVMEAQDQLRKIVQAQGFTERDILMHERGFDWSALLSAGQSMSLFGDKKYVEFRIPTGKPGRDGGDALKQFAQQIKAQSSSAPETIFCIFLPKLDFQTQKSAWFTALDDAAFAVKIDSIERGFLSSWIAMRLKNQKQYVVSSESGQRALSFMVDQVEGNLIAAHQEIQKLALLYPEGALTEEQVRDSVLNVARYDVFQLTEAYLAGDMTRINRMLDGLRGEGEALVLVVWAVTEEVRTLYQLKKEVIAGGHLPSLMKSRRIWGRREQMIPQALNRLSVPMLERSIEIVAQLDCQSKGLVVKDLPADPWDGLRRIGGIFSFR
jgi:DNA polymerase-3 subunit delta